MNKRLRVGKLELHFLYRNDLEKLMTDMGIISNKSMPKEKIRKMKIWNDLFYCADRISRGEYDFLKHTISRLEELKGQYFAVALQGLGKKVMIIEYPPNTAIEKELRRRLESVNIGVNIAEYKG